MPAVRWGGGAEFRNFADVFKYAGEQLKKLQKKGIKIAPHVVKGLKEEIALKERNYEQGIGMFDQQVYGPGAIEAKLVNELATLAHHVDTVVEAAELQPSEFDTATEELARLPAAGIYVPPPTLGAPEFETHPLELPPSTSDYVMTPTTVVEAAVTGYKPPPTAAQLVMEEVVSEAKSAAAGGLLGFVFGVDSALEATLKQACITAAKAAQDAGLGSDFVTWYGPQVRECVRATLKDIDNASKPIIADLKIIEDGIDPLIDAEWIRLHAGGNPNLMYQVPARTGMLGEGLLFATKYASYFFNSGMRAAVAAVGAGVGAVPERARTADVDMPVDPGIGYKNYIRDAIIVMATSTHSAAAGNDAVLLRNAMIVGCVAGIVVPIINNIARGARNGIALNSDAMDNFLAAAPPPWMHPALNAVRNGNLVGVGLGAAPVTRHTNNDVIRNCCGLFAAFDPAYLAAVVPALEAVNGRIVGPLIEGNFYPKRAANTRVRSDYSHLINAVVAAVANKETSGAIIACSMGSNVKKCAEILNGAAFGPAKGAEAGMLSDIFAVRGKMFVRSEAGDRRVARRVSDAACGYVAAIRGTNPAVAKAKATIALVCIRKCVTMLESPECTPVNGPRAAIAELRGDLEHYLAHIDQVVLSENLHEPYSDALDCFFKSLRIARIHWAIDYAHDDAWDVGAMTAMLSVGSTRVLKGGNIAEIEASCRAAMRILISYRRGLVAPPAAIFEQPLRALDSVGHRLAFELVDAVRHKKIGINELGVPMDASCDGEAALLIAGYMAMCAIGSYHAIDQATRASLGMFVITYSINHYVEPALVANPALNKTNIRWADVSAHVAGVGGRSVVDHVSVVDVLSKFSGPSYSFVIAGILSLKVVAPARRPSHLVPCILTHLAKRPARPTDVERATLETEMKSHVTEFMDIETEFGTRLTAMGANLDVADPEAKCTADFGECMKMLHTFVEASWCTHCDKHLFDLLYTAMTVVKEINLPVLRHGRLDSYRRIHGAATIATCGVLLNDCGRAIREVIADPPLGHGDELIRKTVFRSLGNVLAASAVSGIVYPALKHVTECSIKAGFASDLAKEPYKSAAADVKSMVVSMTLIAIRDGYSVSRAKAPVLGVATNEYAQTIARYESLVGDAGPVVRFFNDWLRAKHVDIVNALDGVASKNDDLKTLLGGMTPVAKNAALISVKKKAGIARISEAYRMSMESSLVGMMKFAEESLQANPGSPESYYAIHYAQKSLDSLGKADEKECTSTASFDRIRSCCLIAMEKAKTSPGRIRDPAPPLLHTIARGMNKLVACVEQGDEKDELMKKITEMSNEMLCERIVAAAGAWATEMILRGCRNDALMSGVAVKCCENMASLNAALREYAADNTAMRERFDSARDLALGQLKLGTPTIGKVIKPPALGDPLTMTHQLKQSLLTSLCFASYHGRVVDAKFASYVVQNLHGSGLNNSTTTLHGDAALRALPGAKPLLLDLLGKAACDAAVLGSVACDAGINVEKVLTKAVEQVLEMKKTDDNVCKSHAMTDPAAKGHYLTDGKDAADWKAYSAAPAQPVPTSAVGYYDAINHAFFSNLASALAGDAIGEEHKLTIHADNPASAFFLKEKGKQILPSTTWGFGNKIACKMLSRDLYESYREARGIATTAVRSAISSAAEAYKEYIGLGGAADSQKCEWAAVLAAEETAGLVWRDQFHIVTLAHVGDTRPLKAVRDEVFKLVPGAVAETIHGIDYPHCRPAAATAAARHAMRTIFAGAPKMRDVLGRTLELLAMKPINWDDILDLDDLDIKIDDMMTGLGPLGVAVAVDVSGVVAATREFMGEVKIEASWPPELTNAMITTYSDLYIQSGGANHRATAELKNGLVTFNNGTGVWYDDWVTAHPKLYAGGAEYVGQMFHKFEHNDYEIKLDPEFGFVPEQYWRNNFVLEEKTGGVGALIHANSVPDEYPPALMIYKMEQQYSVRLDANVNAFLANVWAKIEKDVDAKYEPTLPNTPAQADAAKWIDKNLRVANPPAAGYLKDAVDKLGLFVQRKAHVQACKWNLFIEVRKSTPFKENAQLKITPSMLIYFGNRAYADPALGVAKLINDKLTDTIASANAQYSNAATRKKEYFLDVGGIGALDRPLVHSVFSLMLVGGAPSVATDVNIRAAGAAGAFPPVPVLGLLYDATTAGGGTSNDAGNPIDGGGIESGIRLAGATMATAGLAGAAFVGGKFGVAVAVVLLLLLIWFVWLAYKKDSALTQLQTPPDTPPPALGRHGT
jgi:hypothetical protein